jgi:hypothetical protein
VIEEREDDCRDSEKKSVLSKQTIAAVCSIAAADRQIAATFKRSQPVALEYHASP